MSTNRQVGAPSTEEFLRQRPVFSLEELAEALGTDNSHQAAKQRIKYHVGRGRLMAVERGLYAAVPPGSDPERFQPDRYLVAQAARGDAVFSHHAALELLGAAHSEWSQCTVYTSRRRRPLEFDGVEIRFLDHPIELRREDDERLGVTSLDREGVELAVTGPERTLVDGFRKPKWAGGLEELVDSAAGFGVLDLDLLDRVLRAFDQKVLWATTGWFLERHQDTFFVPDAFLDALEQRKPASPVYVPRGQRGGKLVDRWNLVLPVAVLGGGSGEA